MQIKQAAEYIKAAVGDGFVVEIDLHDREGRRIYVRNDDWFWVIRFAEGNFNHAVNYEDPNSHRRRDHWVSTVKGAADTVIDLVKRTVTA